MFCELGKDDGFYDRQSEKLISGDKDKSACLLSNCSVSGADCLTQVTSVLTVIFRRDRNRAENQLNTIGGKVSMSLMFGSKEGSLERM